MGKHGAAKGSCAAVLGTGRQGVVDWGGGCQCAMGQHGAVAGRLCWGEACEGRQIGRRETFVFGGLIAATASAVRGLADGLVSEGGMLCVAGLLTSSCVIVACPTDNSRKAFYKEFRRVVEAADVVIQVGRTGLRGTGPGQRLGRGAGG